MTGTIPDFITVDRIRWEFVIVALVVGIVVGAVIAKSIGMEETPDA